jgi:hypothetical protein
LTWRKEGDLMHQIGVIAGDWRWRRDRGRLADAPRDQLGADRICAGQAGRAALPGRPHWHEDAFRGSRIGTLGSSELMTTTLTPTGGDVSAALANARAPC